MAYIPPEMTEHILQFSDSSTLKNCIQIKDLTGAGDLFAAGFLNGHVNKLMIKDSLQMGTDMATKIIQKIGARLN